MRNAADPHMNTIRRRLHRLRAAAIAQYRRQPQPEALLTALRTASDTILQDLLTLQPLPDGAALAAVGGYGRGELYPHSDLDILILLREEPDDSAIEAIETLIAAMWDIGLEPGHSVRTLTQCKHLAAGDVTIETSLLEARWLAGDRHLVEQLLHQMRTCLDPAGFFQAKRTEMRQRHAYYHNTAYALEPNCKESPGGLRDLQSLLWVAQAAGYGSSWADVARSGALTRAEYRSLRRAHRAFMRLRIELHLLTGRREDRVVFALQPELARLYGFQASATRSRSELLMQRYYWAARVVSQLTTILMQDIEERLFSRPGRAELLDADFLVRDSRLDLRCHDSLEHNPTLILHAFLRVQQHPALTGLTAASLRALWHARRHIDQHFRRNPANQAVFLSILKQERGVAGALYAMSRLGILPRYLPAFRRIVGQMQHDLFHAYTVDEHILRVVRNLSRFSMADHAHEYPRASRLIAEFDQSWLLYVTALFHDIAKGRGGDHSELGAREAQKFCDGHGMTGDQTELVVYLVRHHLLMSMTAQKKDLSDPLVIHAFADSVGSERRLNALYLLTIADIRATGPTIWNTWKGRLLDDLYDRAIIALGGAQPDASTVLAYRKQEATAALALAGVDTVERDAVWNVLDIAYFMRHEADEIAWHTEQIAGRIHDSTPVVRARVLGHNEALQVMIYTPDRKELFSTLCQYFDRHTFSVQEARIHTSSHGWALDSFIVLFDGPDIAYDRCADDVEETLLAHLTARSQPLPLPPTQRSATPMRTDHGMPRRRQTRAFPVLARIDLEPDPAQTSWRLSITCADRPGLLHDLSRLFSAHDINVRMAKILTLGQRAEDTFIIESDELTNSLQRRQFEHAALQVLSAGQ